MTTMMVTAPTLAAFEAWAQRYGPQVNAQTAKRYRAYAAAFEQEYGRAQDATRETCRAWYEALSKTAAKSTINVKIGAMRAYFSYLQDQGVVQASVMDGINMLKRDRDLPKPVDHSDITRLLQHVRARAVQSLWHRQDLAIIETLYGSGLRREECALLTLGQIEGREALRVTGKGNKTRITIITEHQFSALMSWVVAYLGGVDGAMLQNEGEKEALFWRMRRQSPDTPCFYTTTGRPLATQADPGHYIYLRLTTLSREAGLAMTPHRLRHSFGTELLNGGADLYSVAQVMGHEDVRTTKGYAELNMRGLRAIRAAHTRQGDDE